MLELINIIVNREDFYRLTLMFDYYGLSSERRYYLFLVCKPLLIEKDKMVINYNYIKDRMEIKHKNIKDIIKYA